MLSFARDEVIGPRSSTPITARKRLSLGSCASPIESNQGQSLRSLVGRPLVQSVANTGRPPVSRQRSLPPTGPLIQSVANTGRHPVSRQRSLPPTGPRQGSVQQNANHDMVRKSPPQRSLWGVSVGFPASANHKVTQDKYVDNRRRSSPASLHNWTGQQCPSKIFSTATHDATPYLWSLHEENSREVEPMDISPVKCQGPVSPIHSVKSDDISNNLENSDETLSESQNEPIRKRKVVSSSWCACAFTMVLINLALAAGAVFVAMFGSDFYKTWCSGHQKMNITQLSESLHSRVFGQHIALDVIPRAIDEYLEKGTAHHHNPLVISLHGWTGVGKNFLSFLITHHLTRGKPKNVIVTLDYGQHDKNYSEIIAYDIVSQISPCAVSVFVVDEIDKSTESVLVGIINVLRLVRSSTYDLRNRKVIFLLLSNTGGYEINGYLLNELYSGRQRDTVKQKELVDILKETSKKKESFAWFRQMLQANLIDVIVPFLPLERVHVEDCIRADLRSKCLPVTDSVVQKVIDELSFSPDDNPIFSKSGCRKVSVKVDLTVD